jgi:hypothetical protein
MTGMRPASFWTRRRAHKAAVHLADAQLAAGWDVDLAAGLAADGVDEWLGHGKADVAVRGPAADLLLVPTRRLPPSTSGVEILGQQALLTHWLEHTPFWQIHDPSHPRLAAAGPGVSAETLDAIA